MKKKRERTIARIGVLEKKQEKRKNTNNHIAHKHNYHDLLRYLLAVKDLLINWKTAPTDSLHSLVLLLALVYITLLFFCSNMYSTVFKEMFVQFFFATIIVQEFFLAKTFFPYRQGDFFRCSLYTLKILVHFLNKFCFYCFALKSLCTC
jgi:hypothetical protein